MLPAVLTAVLICYYLIQAFNSCDKLELAVLSCYYLRQAFIRCVKLDLAVSISNYLMQSEGKYYQLCHQLCQSVII